MTTVHRFPASRQAYAIACPKLPELAVMMAGCGTERTTLDAARNLKLPVHWKASLAIAIVASRRSDRRTDRTMVVGRGLIM
jgi:hypothetical protein